MYKYALLYERTLESMYNSYTAREVTQKKTTYGEEREYFIHKLYI